MSDLKLFKSEDVGLSSERLSEIDSVIETAMSKKSIPGAAVVVSRHNKPVYYKNFGIADDNIAIDNDTVYWIASLSKPILAVAIMQLFDRGKLSLTDSVASFLPEFANLRVLEFDQNGVLLKALPQSELTIHHLLSMTGGFIDSSTYSDSDPDKHYHIAEELLKNGIVDGVVPSKVPVREMAARYSDVPIAYHPGRKFNYGNAGSTILAAVVEELSGIKYDTYLRKEIFDPLMMNMTTFFPEETNKIAKIYLARDGQEGKKGDKIERPVRNKGAVADIYNPQIPINTEWHFLHAGGGLYSTINDYYQFAQMLAAKGSILSENSGGKGQRLISNEAVRLMSKNRIGELYNPITNNKWGYMLSVQQTDEPTKIYYGGAGAFGRRGISGSEFWINPASDTVVVFMTNAWSSFDIGPIKQKVAQVINYAIE